MFLLVPGYPGRPGQKAVKRLCVCVCACVCVCVAIATKKHNTGADHLIRKHLSNF